MKFSTTLALAASASAVAITPRQQPTLAITAFYADCIPHSVTCSYSFAVTSDPSLPASHCAATLNGPDKLPAVTAGACGDHAAYTWITSRAADGGLNFAVSFSQSEQSNVTYCHNIPGADITVQNGGTVQTEHYVGPRNFTACLSECGSP